MHPNYDGLNDDMTELHGCRNRRLRGEAGSIPEWVMLLVMSIGVVMALWAIVQPDLISIVTDALDKLRG